MGRAFRRLETKLIHAGEPDPRILGAVAMPIFQSAMYETEGGDYHDLQYIRLNNTPNSMVLHAKLAALEGAEAALVTASGMAAITTTLLTFLSAGDHLLAQDTLYGGTHDFLTRDFASFGISFDFVDGNDPKSWESKLRPETKAIYVETITNPLMQVADLEGIAQFARSNEILSIIDNTFATPVNFRPIEHGFDLSLHSCTKYMNGHSDIVAGAVIGRRDLVGRIKAQARSPRGIARSARRVPAASRHEDPRRAGAPPERERARDRAIPGEAARNCARELPGLESHSAHARAKKLFEGFGGMLSYELEGGADAAKKFLAATTLPLKAPSLGSVETLLTLPALTSTPGCRARTGSGSGSRTASSGCPWVSKRPRS